MSDSVNTNVSVDAPAEASGDSQNTEANLEKVDAAATQEKKEAVQKVINKQKFKYKADGQDFEEELDDAEISKRLSLSKSAMKRMNEAHRQKQEAEALIREFQDDPAKIFKRLDAKKARSVAEQLLLEQIQQEMMSPEERQRQEMMTKLQEYEAKEKQQQEEIQATRMAELQAKYTQEYDQKISQALAESGLPRVPATVKRMLQLLHKNIELGLDLSPSDLVDEVKQSYYKEFKEMFGSADVSMILDMFGNDLSNKIRKHDLQKFQQGALTKKTPETDGSPSSSQSGDTKKRYYTMDDFDKHYGFKK